MDNITIIFKYNDVMTEIIVRSKNGSIPNSINYNLDPHVSIDNTLDILGLERVPYNKIGLGYKKIKIGDKLLHEVCSICHEDYKINEFKRELKCEHSFHKKCIDKWLKIHLNCPFCRHSIN